MKLEQAARQALEALEQNTYYNFDDDIKALREALAEQAEQEPVAWNDLDDHELAEKLGWRIGDPLYMTAVGLGQEAIHHFKAKNTAPVRTKDLTGQDLCDLEIAVGWKGDSYDFEVIAKAVIAKFKEKNK